MGERTITGLKKISKRSYPRGMASFAKWMMLASFVGVIVGAVSILFAYVLSFVTEYRTEKGWIFFGLPIAGLIIVFLYDKFGKDDGGVNQVFSTIKSQDTVPAVSAPLIFVATALTHLTGGLYLLSATEDTVEITLK